ncbi:MAG: hypothetical protein P4L77_11170 [Sulfuriferula sp.]|nr:hypothetical protein [Sulfuriferula sp.]
MNNEQSFMASLGELNVGALEQKFKAERVSALGLDEALNRSIEYRMIHRVLNEIVGRYKLHASPELYEQARALVEKPYEHYFVFDRVEEAKWRRAFLEVGGLVNPALAAAQIRPLFVTEDAAGWEPF